MFRSPSRTSTKTGVAPVWTITFAVAGQVIGVVITSSPSPIPSATSARCSAAVPEATARTYFASRYSAIRSSSSAARGPVVSQPDRSASGDRLDLLLADRGRLEAELRSRVSFDDEAYFVCGGASAAERLVAAVADRDHRAGTVGPRAAAARIGSPARGRSARRALPRRRAPPRVPRRPCSIPFGRDEEEDARAARWRLCVSETQASFPSAKSSARSFSFTPVAASVSSASWPPPRRAASSTTRDPSAPILICVYVGPFRTPSASAAARAASIGALCFRNTRPGVRQRDPERRRVGGEAIGDEQRVEDAVDRDGLDGDLRAVDVLLDDVDTVPRGVDRRLDRGRKLLLGAHEREPALALAVGRLDDTRAPARLLERLRAAARRRRRSAPAASTWSSRARRSPRRSDEEARAALPPGRRRRPASRRPAR